MNQTAAPTISVCIANYNGEMMLVDCIESVLGQECIATIEIIVHDDASTDGSVALLASRYPQVNLLASDTNVGFCVSNNRMVAVARGRYVLLLNNDAALMSGALSTLLSASSRTQEPGILTLPQFDWHSGTLVDRGCLLDPFYNPVPNLDPARSSVAYVIGACLWIPHKLWRELGGFPEWMESIGEDIYLCCLARLRGQTVHAVSGSGYRHRQGANFGGNRPIAGKLESTLRRRRLSERNKTFALFLFSSRARLGIVMPIHFVGLAFEASMIGLVQNNWRQVGEIYGGALLSLVRRRRLLWRLRQQIQQSRNTSWISFYRCFKLMPRKLALLVRYGLPRIR
ncbi:MAG: glycosyltransferase [Luteimonas sp.]